MVELIGPAWRNHLAGVVAEARDTILVAVPFIKYEEAVWLCRQMDPEIEITTLTNINAEAVSSAALDISALRCLANISRSAKLIALPNLHAKVFVADETAAIVTSGNLTRSALERNIEYGVVIREPTLVRTIRQDMMSFARIGRQVNTGDLAELARLEKKLRVADAQVSRSTAFKRRFNEILQRPQPAAALSGQPSPHAVFREAIQFVLRQGPKNTTVIQREVRQLRPDLCDDREYFLIKGKPYGKTWMRRLRHAQQYLKIKGLVRYDPGTRTWALTRP